MMSPSPTTSDRDRSTGFMLLPSGPNLSSRVVIVWHQGKAKINRLFANGPPETRITRESTCRFPQEIVEMIVAQSDDLDTLKACSLACRSWYIAALPRIHRTLILTEGRPDKRHDKLKPLSKLHKLGLAPLVKQITVQQQHNSPWFTPQAFSRRNLHYFSPFANVRILRLDFLDISRFTPDMERHFKHFSPTLRSIVLRHPCCTPRQLSYFLSFFSNLDDICIMGESKHQPYTTPDTELVPFSAQGLQGKLTLYKYRWVKTWTQLITSCGGLRFRRMHLHKVGTCAPILFEACAETLETLRIYPTDVSVGSPGFDLSRLRVLRSLQVEDWAANFTSASARDTILIETFSTITSPAFSELVLVLRNDETTHLPSDVTLFKTLRAMRELRAFKLVFLLATPNQLRGEARRKLAEALDLVRAKGFLNSSPPCL